MFLLLAFVENIVLFSLGVSSLNEEYDHLFKIIAGVLCLLSYIIGVVLQYIYYGCFGHPWVNINGPNVEKISEKTVLVSFYKEGGDMQWELTSCCKCENRFKDEEDDVYIPKSFEKAALNNSHVKSNGHTNGSITSHNSSFVNRA